MLNECARTCVLYRCLWPQTEERPLKVISYIIICRRSAGRSPIKHIIYHNVIYCKSKISILHDPAAMIVVYLYIYICFNRRYITNRKLYIRPKSVLFYEQIFNLLLLFEHDDITIMTNGLHDNVMLQLVKKLLYKFLTECVDTRPKLFKLHYYTPLHNVQNSSFLYIIISNALIPILYYVISDLSSKRSGMLQNTEYILYV